MKKNWIFLALLFVFTNQRAQTAKDLFTHNDVKIYWLGIDYSHVKLVGTFYQIGEGGAKSALDIRDNYFPSWNYLVLGEPAKYDVHGMLRKEQVVMDIAMINKINSNTILEEMEATESPVYGADDIAKFVKEYDTEGKTGIGIVLVAECLNKYTESAYYHFVAMNMATKEILVYDRLRGEAKGFGIRNYWANSFYTVMKEIKIDMYNAWKRKYVK